MRPSSHRTSGRSGIHARRRRLAGRGPRPMSSSRSMGASKDRPGCFLLPQDKGYYKAAGLDVTIDEAARASESITRVALRCYDMAFTDINALIKYRDQHPSTPIKAAFMVYNKPGYAIVGRRSRGITEPKNLEGKKLGAPPTSSTVGNGRCSPSSTASTSPRDGRKPSPRRRARADAAAGQLDAVLWLLVPDLRRPQGPAAYRSTISCCCRWRITGSSSTATRSS